MVTSIALRDTNRQRPGIPTGKYAVLMIFFFFFLHFLIYTLNDYHAILILCIRGTRLVMWKPIGARTRPNAVFYFCKQVLLYENRILGANRTSSRSGERERGKEIQRETGGERKRKRDRHVGRGIQRQADKQTVRQSEEFEVKVKCPRHCCWVNEYPYLFYTFILSPCPFSLLQPLSFTTHISGCRK